MHKQIILLTLFFTSAVLPNDGLNFYEFSRNEIYYLQQQLKLKERCSDGAIETIYDLMRFQNKNQDTNLHIAIRRNDYQGTKLLLSLYRVAKLHDENRFKKQQHYLIQTDCTGNNFLHAAAEMENFNNFKQVILFFNDVFPAEWVLKLLHETELCSGWNILHLVAASEKKAPAFMFAKNVLEQVGRKNFGELVRQRDKDGRAPHYYAFYNKNINLKALLSRKLYKIKRSKRKPGKEKLPALHIAAANGDAEAVKVLLQYGENPNKLDQSGKTALQRAILNNHKDVAVLLINHIRRLSV